MEIHPRFVQALDEAAQAAVTQFPQERVRIFRGLAMAKAGCVDLQYGLGYAKVRSQHQAKTYMVNGECSCHDAAFAPEGRCKHKYAVWILRKAMKRLLHTYYATYEPGHGHETITGLAERSGDGWMFAPESGGMVPLSSTCPSLVLGGCLALTESQALVDRNNMMTEDK